MKGYILAALLCGCLDTQLAGLIKAAQEIKAATEIQQPIVIGGVAS